MSLHHLLFLSLFVSSDTSDQLMRKFFYRWPGGQPERTYRCIRLFLINDRVTNSCFISHVHGILALAIPAHFHDTTILAKSSTLNVAVEHDPQLYFLSLVTRLHMSLLAIIWYDFRPRVDMTSGHLPFFHLRFPRFGFDRRIEWQAVLWFTRIA